MAAPEFLTLLKKSGLLSPAQWNVALEVAVRHDQSESLCAELVRLGLLTTWQSTQLLKGQTGFVLQHYRLLEAIGRGGMGHVFKAVDSRDASIVAIKVMSRKLSANPHLVNRFKREIRASSLLNSPHIVRTLDAGRVGKVDFMVMEYVHGDQLDSILARVPQIPIPMVCEVIRHAALGLQHAHERKMVHRDIKPGNLMIDWSAEGQGTVKIMDMGLVRLSEDTEEHTSVTRAGQVMGTPDYMSPEQGWNTATVDIRSDIYSLGCTFFRLLTGRVPFPGDNPLQVLMARCSKDAPSARSIRPEIPEPINAILQKMTLRDPDARFQTPAEVADALTSFCAPITVEGLRNSARDSSGDDGLLLQSASQPDFSDPQDAGYQQFLREMDTGAAVDLMLTSTSAGNHPLQSTLPTITPRPQSFADRRLSDSATSLRKRRTALIAISVSAAAVALIALVVLLKKSTAPPSVARENSPPTPIVAPTATLASTPPVKIRAGETLRFQPTFEGPAPPTPQHGQLLWKLGDAAPLDATIDQNSGNVQWLVPSQLSTAAYVIPVELHFQHEGNSSVIASTQLVASVQSDNVAWVMPPAPPARIKPGQSFSWTPEISPKLQPDAGLRFRLARTEHSDIALDPANGTLTWTPDVSDLGRHPVTVELVDADEKNVLAKVTRTLIVLPESLRFSLPVLPEQTIQSGTQLRLNLFENTPPVLGRLIEIKIRRDGAPAGVALENRGSVLTWNVPKETSGRFEVVIEAQPLFPEVRIAEAAPPQSRIIINVLPAASPRTSPPDDAVAQAEQELRNLYKRDLAVVSKRTTLTRKLIELAYEQDPGAADFALLKIILETENKNRVADSLLEALLLRKQRYGVPDLDAALSLLQDLKTTSLSPAQQDRLIEHGLRLATDAATQQKWADTATLLRVPAELLRKASKGSIAEQLSTDVARAAQLATELAAGSGQADAVRSQELSAALKRWQFQPAFDTPDKLSWASTSNASQPALANNGKGLWSFPSDRILLKSDQKPASVGFLDPGFDSNRWMLRMQVQGNSHSLLVILGASAASRTLTGHLLCLDDSAFGRVIALPANTTVLTGNATVHPPREGWNDFEILVDENSLKVRLNGEQVLQGTLPALKSGQPGLLASLQQASGDTVLQLRNPRLLRLPSRPQR